MFDKILIILTGLILIGELRILSPWRFSPRQAKTDRSFWLIVLALMLAAASFYFLPAFRLPRLPLIVRIIGWLVLLDGFILRQWAIITLRQHFRPVVTVTADQSLVRRGPYRFLRHPGYTGLLLEVIGLALAWGNWLALVVSLATVWPAIVYRVGYEEEILIGHFGQAYLNYQKQVGGLWPKRG